MYSLASFSVLSLNNLGASFITITLPFLVSTILDFTFLNLFVENILKVFAFWFSRKLIKLFIVILNFLKLKLLYSRFEFSCIWLGILFNSTLYLMVNFQIFWLQQLFLTVFSLIKYIQLFISFHICYHIIKHF